MFSRQKRQRMAERMGFRAASTYHKDFEAGLTIMENTAVGSERMVVAARKHGAIFWVPNLKADKPEYPTAEAANTAGALGAALTLFPYSNVLLKQAKVWRAMTVEQQNYARDVDIRFALPLKEWLATRDEGYRAAKLNMEARRLEMDNAAWAARNVAENLNDPKKIKAEWTARAHAEAMVKVQGFVNPIGEDHMKHKLLLGELLALQRRYHANCDAELERTHRELELMSASLEFQRDSASKPK